VSLSAFVTKYIRELAESIVDASTRSHPGAPTFKVVWGVVHAIHAGPPETLDIYISGNANLSTGIRYLGSYSPTVGDVAMCLKHGKYYLAMGARSPEGGGSGYASLTGAGETNPIGALEQTGNFTVANPTDITQVHFYLGGNNASEFADFFCDGSLLTIKQSLSGHALQMSFESNGQDISLDASSSTLTADGDVYITPNNSHAVRIGNGITGMSFGIFNKASSPATQVATPVTLGDVIALLQSYGWCP